MFRARLSSLLSTDLVTLYACSHRKLRAIKAAYHGVKHRQPVDCLGVKCQGRKYGEA